ncbi:AbiH family protein [Carnobacterium maltaromaticum]|uniref:AbiH family protein n=1 Tax=Carnobacterium maltaromaticum TaxID=2751 RepID=UPI00295EC0EF|nr:AbiH family protein [Carnobacterium maltaromaticum]
MNNMDNNELLIIGNGFDLSLGLRTTYQNFFEKRYENKLLGSLIYYIENETQSSLNTCVFELRKIPNVNFWDIFFILKYVQSENIDKNWSNIEEEIKIFLTHDEIGESLGKKSLKNCLDHFSKKNLSEAMKLEYSRYALMLLQFIKKFTGLNSDNLDHFLNSELIIFEGVFAEYINNEVRNNDQYEKKSEQLIELLVSDVTKSSILSFNYTELKHKDLISIENVHGKSNQKIIFGIDYKNLDYNSEEYKYSKTYRKLLTNVSNNDHEALPNDIKKIKFYGHSLSDADYSYFQSIFDYYSIYNGVVDVEFFFNVYDEKNRASILNNQLTAVTSLLSIYGETMSNEDHGKNLIHKLLLENRIRITEIDSTGNLANP